MQIRWAARALVLPALLLGVTVLPLATACTFPPPQPTGLHYLFTFSGPDGNLTVDSGLDTSESDHAYCESPAGPVVTTHGGPPVPDLLGNRTVLVGHDAYDVPTATAYHANTMWQARWAAQGWLYAPERADAMLVADLANRTMHAHSLGTNSGLSQAIGPRPVLLAATYQPPARNGTSREYRFLENGLVRFVAAFDLASGAWWFTPGEADVPANADPVDANPAWMLLTQPTANGTALWGLDAATRTIHGPWPALGVTRQLAGDSAVVSNGTRRWAVRLTDGAVAAAPAPLAPPGPAPAATTRDGTPQPQGTGWRWVEMPVLPARMPNPTGDPSAWASAFAHAGSLRSPGPDGAAPRTPAPGFLLAGAACAAAALAVRRRT